MSKVICQYCNNKARLINGADLYGKDIYINKWFYACLDCRSWVGTHKDGKPLGTLANTSLRKRRNAAHRHFDILWKDGYMTRTKAYLALSFAMDIPPKFTHIALFTEEQCIEVVNISKELLKKELSKNDTSTKSEFKNKKENIQDSRPHTSLFKND